MLNNDDHSPVPRWLEGVSRTRGVRREMASLRGGSDFIFVQFVQSLVEKE